MSEVESCGVCRPADFRSDEPSATRIATCRHGKICAACSVTERNSVPARSSVLIGWFA